MKPILSSVCLYLVTVAKDIFYCKKFLHADALRWTIAFHHLSPVLPLRTAKEMRWNGNAVLYSLQVCEISSLLSHSFPFFNHKHWWEAQKNCALHTLTTSRHSKMSSVVQRKWSWCFLLKAPKGSSRHLSWADSAASNGHQKRKRGQREYWLCGNLGGSRTDVVFMLT